MMPITRPIVGSRRLRVPSERAQRRLDRVRDRGDGIRHPREGKRKEQQSLGASPNPSGELNGGVQRSHEASFEWSTKLADQASRHTWANATQRRWRSGPLRTNLDEISTRDARFLMRA